MHRPVLAALLAALAFALVGAQSALASARHDQHHGHGRKVVFVQTNQTGGNAIVVFVRAHDGTLEQAGTYPTGGLGGTAAGSASDHLASQGSLAYDAGGHALVAVNAGSDTVSAFRVHGDRLRLEDVVPSGGQFPASVAIDDGLVYVLNSGGSGSVAGFRLDHGALIPIPGSVRSLGLANANPPNFLSSPGQVGFSPDGRQLLVTTKASTSSIDVFGVRPDGRLSAAPVVNASATPVPFAFTFDPSSGRLVAGEAGASSVTTYRLQNDGTLAGAQSASDGQAALCWIQRVGAYYFVSNTGSNTLSSFWLAPNGQPVLLNAVAASTPAGPIDLAASDGFLYAETGIAGTVEEYAVQADGSLVSIGSVTGLPAGLEGIAAS